MKKLLLFTMSLAMALTVNAAYYLTGGNINGGEHWDPAYLQFTPVDGNPNTYTAHLDSFGGEFKITNGNWGDGNEWGSNGNQIQKGVAYALTHRVSSSNIPGNVSIAETYTNVDLTLVDNSGELTLTINDVILVSNTWYIWGEVEDWNTANAVAMEDMGDGVYEATVETLSKEFKFIWEANTATQIGVYSDNVNTVIPGETFSLVKGGISDNLGNIKTYQYDSNAINLKNIKVVLRTADDNYSVTLVPQKWYYIGEYNGWNLNTAAEMSYNDATGCFEYEGNNIRTNFKLINDRQWNCGEWTCVNSTDRIRLNTPFQLKGSKDPNNILFEYINIVDGKISINPSTFQVTITGNVTDGSFPELQFVGSLTGNDSDDWGKTENGYLPLTLDPNTGNYTSAYYNFRDNLEFKIRQGSDWNGSNWGASEFTYSNHSGVLTLGSGDNASSTIAGRHAVCFNIYTLTLTFLEDYNFTLDNVGESSFHMTNHRHYFDYKISHEGGSGVKHYLIEVYRPALPLSAADGRRRVESSELIVGSVKHTDFDNTSGSIELTNLPANDLVPLMVRAVAVPYYGSDTYPATNSSEFGSTLYGYYQADGTTTGIEEIIADYYDEPAQYFDLQGRRVVNPANGIFIRVKNGQADKVKL